MRGEGRVVVTRTSPLIPRPSRSRFDGDAHAAGGAFDDPFRALDAGGVQVLHLELGDLTQLAAAECADGRLAGRAGALVDVQRLLDEVRRRRGLGDEGERAVLEDGD